MQGDERPRLVGVAERTLENEKFRCGKLEYACALYDKILFLQQQPFQLSPLLEKQLADMELRQSRWKPRTEINYEPLGDAVRLEDAGWDADAHAQYPTLADNPAAATVINAIPELTSLNILIDHLVMVDRSKPQFHQPTREPIRVAMLSGIKKEMETHNLRFEELEFYYVIGANQSAHVCLPSTMVDRILNRILNTIGLKSSKASQVARLTNWADVRLRTFKAQSELTKTLTKADRTTESFRVGAEMLKMMSNLSHFDLMVSLDLEAWELGQNRLTEFGIAVYEPKTDTLTPYHFIIEDNLHLKNGKMLPHYRDNFLYGQSKTVSLIYAHKYLCDLLSPSNGIVALAGHGITSDLNMILDAGLPRLPTTGVTIIDTQTLFLQVDRAADRSRLEDVLEYFKIPSSYLHNAGNDAFYTLMICLKIAGVDTDRYLSPQ